MRELSACDFCGREAAGVYEVVPGDVSGVPARRMVLCEGCRDTLSEVVDPLLDAISAGTGSERVGDAEATGTGPATEPDPSPGSSSTPEPESSPESAPEEADARNSAAGGAGAEAADQQQSPPERLERPEGYGQVVRLVENRDAGIPRADLEALASSAYGLNATAVDAAIDFAIEQGRFEETEGGLQTT